MTVFEFTDFRAFIKYRFSLQLYNSIGRKKSNLSRITKNLGYSSPSLLSMVLNGKRLPSDELCEVLIRNWNLTLKEGEYFRLLVELERKRNQGQDTTETVQRISRVTPNRSIKIFKDSEFSAIREWYFHVIQLLVESPGFREDPHWISKTLRRKITPRQAELAIEKLEQLGLLERDPISKQLKVGSSFSETTHNIPSSAIRLHHKEMISRALEALEESPVAERTFNSLAFHVEPERLPAIRQRILDFTREINSEFAGKQTNSIYQLNIQFFEHTANLKPSLEGEKNELH